MDISEKAEIEMPLAINKNILKAYGLYFDKIWNFYLDLDNLGIIPEKSYFLIDLVLNEIEIYATCELANSNNQSSTISKLFCYLDNKVEINYILLEGEYETIAKNWTNGGSQNEKILILCNVIKEIQSENGLIQIKYFKTEKSTLIWNGGIDDNYKITLKGIL